MIHKSFKMARLEKYFINPITLDTIDSQLRRINFRQKKSLPELNSSSKDVNGLIVLPKSKYPTEVNPSKQDISDEVIQKEWLKIVSKYIFKKYIKNNMKSGGWISEQSEPRYFNNIENNFKLFEYKTFISEGGVFDFRIRPISLKNL